MLLRLIRGTDTDHFLVLKPSGTVATRLAALTGLADADVDAATLAGIEGTVVDLSGFDARDRHTYRRIAARGWAAVHGSQICPQCIASGGVWRLCWRTPYSAICVQHETYLLTECSGCRRPFRDGRHSALRAVGASTECGNPIDAGPRKHCCTNLAHLAAVCARDDEVSAQRRIDAAMDGATTVTLGNDLAGRDYLRELRALAVLLFHLATQPGLHLEPAWVSATRLAAVDRTGDRGPRWGIRPPDDPVARAGAFTVADTILGQPDLDAAAERLTEWLDRVPVVPEGVLGWLADRTQMTETVSALIIKAHAPHRRLSHLLDQTGTLAPAAYVPQVIPDDLYQRHLHMLFDSTSDTVRSFAAICLARTDTEAKSWADAGALLGLLPGTAERTARACSARALVKPQRVVEALTAVARDLPTANRREVEARVRGLRRGRSWFEVFAANRPGTRASSKGYAITWIWLNVAHGHLATSPGWTTPPTGRQRALYRQFAHSLGHRNKEHLRNVIIDVHHSRDSDVTSASTPSPTLATAWAAPGGSTTHFGCARLGSYEDEVSRSAHG